MNSTLSVRSAKPTLRLAPKAQRSDGDDACFLASGYGLTADAWQADLVTDWLGRDAREKYVAGTCAITVARQNGKNGAIEIRELFGMVVLGEAFLHTAHEVKTARKSFKRLLHFFGDQVDDPAAKYPELNALVDEIRKTNGQEAIFLKDVTDDDGNVIRAGGSIEFVARSRGSGRGYTVDVLVIDEAQELNDEQLEALRPTISSAPLKTPQVIYAGTAPNPEKQQLGTVLRRIRDRAKAKRARVAFTDFGLEGPMPDVDDRGLWHETNPALGDRLLLSVVEDERTDLSDEGFARERLCWWGNPDAPTGGVLDMAQWERLGNATAKQPTHATVAIDVSPNQASASIGVAASGSDGKTLVLSHTQAGTAWIVAALQQMIAARSIAEVALFPGSQAAVLIPELTKAGIEFEALTSRDVGQACGYFQKAVREGTIEHVAQPELDAAAANATTRWAGEVEVWNRRERTIDISAIVAVSIAASRWGATAEPEYDVLDSIL